MDAPVGTVSIDISPVFDALYWAFILATLLSGITIVQGWVYINNCERDHWILRLFVMILILADLLTTSLDLMVLHFSLIKNFGNLEPLGHIITAASVEFALTLVVVFLVQLFFASRIYMFKKERWWIPGMIVFFAAVGLGVGAVEVVEMFRFPVMSYLTTAKSKILLGISGFFSAFVDIIITISLSWTISSAKVGVKHTDTLLQKLLVYIVSRGLLVSITQVLFLIIYLWRPGSPNWAPFHFASSKIYVITVVAMLNGRHVLREQQGGNVFSSSTMFTDSGPRDRVPAQRIVVRKTIELGRFEDDIELGVDGKHTGVD
ncbi:hypothetical protein BV22DRAFT_1192152 [Leucogyrophana mollusca]|uniref:Uncharacterized protein n=1 Tax=Leucogyrophana mollusca TaxID=85980 RepID=A0ACB8BTG8_9AGAM|nr:hypothetical protein BV22DRAFT_1192152 [Leucogyrophana mollusca]